MIIRSIQARIAASLLVLLGLIFFVAGVTLVSGDEIARQFDRFRSAQRAAERVSAVAERATNLQFRVAEYVRSERASDLDATRVAQADLLQSMTGLQTTSVGGVAHLRTTAAALAGLTTLISDAIIARHAVGAELADNGSALSSTLTAIMDAALQDAAYDLEATVGKAIGSAQRSGLFATRYLVSASPADLAAARADLAYLFARLAELTPATADLPRLRRHLALAADEARLFGGAVDTLERDTLARSTTMPALNAAIQSLKTSLDATHGALGAEAAAAEAVLTEQLRRAAILIASFAGSALCLGLLCMLVIKRTCVTPLNDLVGSVRALADNDLDRPIQHIGRSDEIGEVAAALETLRVQASAAKDAARQAAEFAAAALVDRQRLVNESAEATERALGEIARSIGVTAERLLSAADELNGIAGRTSDRAADVVTGSVQGHGRAEQVAVEADRLASLIGLTETRVSNAAGVTVIAARDAQESEATVRSLSDAAAGVHTASRLIAQVARRTKLLALNAAIEAARSGEAGRGFTVVANEVKALAAQTASANEQIAREVDAMRLAADSSAAKLNNVRDAIGSVSQLTLDVAETFRQQQLFIRSFVEQAAESAKSSGHVATAMQAVLDNAHEAARSADDLRNVAANLAVQGSALDGQLGKVVGELRAA